MSGRKRRLLKWIVAAQSRFRQRGTSLSPDRPRNRPISCAERAQVKILHRRYSPGIRAARS